MKKLLILLIVCVLTVGGGMIGLFLKIAFSGWVLGIGLVCLISVIDSECKDAEH